MLEIEQAVRERWAGEPEVLLLRRTKELSDQVTAAAAMARESRRRERESELGRALTFTEMKSVISETRSAALEETVAQIWDGVGASQRQPRWLNPELSAEERDEAVLEKRLPALQRWTSLAATSQPSDEAESLAAELWPDRSVTWMAHAEMLIQALIEDLGPNQTADLQDLKQVLPSSPADLAVLVDQRVAEVEQALKDLSAETR